MAAISGSLSSHNETEATLNRVAASDQWNYYQAKGIKLKEDEDSDKLNVEIAKVQALLAAKPGKQVPSAAAPAPTASELADNVARYKEEQEKIKDKATELNTESDIELKRHETFSYGVTLFQVAIAISAISILTKKRRYWGVSLLFGAGGLFFLIFGLLQYLKH